MFGVAADTGTALWVTFDGDGGGAETGALDGYGAAAGPDVPDQAPGPGPRRESAKARVADLEIMPDRSSNSSSGSAQRP